MCFEEYITIEEDAPSDSGLYFTDLSGCTSSILTDLMKEGHADEQACFDYIYKKAQSGLKIDLHRKLAGRFHIDKKLITRETSVYNSTLNGGSGYAGVQIKVTLPKYGRLQILSIDVKSNAAYSSPAAEFKIFKTDSSGELLYSKSADLVVGRNSVKVYEDFEEAELFVAYSPGSNSLYKTDNLYFPQDSSNQDLECTFPCGGGSMGSIQQINGGGINVKFVLYCSIEKFICENLPLFQFALHYGIGVESMKERITTQNVNISSVLTEERAKELLALYNEEYKDALDVAVMNIKMTEDPICFSCKRTVSAKTNLP
jgi:hypothetical protein